MWGRQPVADAGTQTIGGSNRVWAEPDGVAEGLDPGGPPRADGSQPIHLKALPPRQTSASGPATNGEPTGAPGPERLKKSPESFELPWFSSGRAKPATRGRAAGSTLAEAPQQKERSETAGGPSDTAGVPSGGAGQTTTAGRDRKGRLAEGDGSQSALPEPPLGGTSGVSKRPPCHCSNVGSAELAVAREGPRTAAPKPGNLSSGLQPCPRRDGPAAEKSVPVRSKLRQSEAAGGLKARLDDLERLVEAQFCQLQSAGYIGAESGTQGSDGGRGPPSLRELERAIEEQHDDLVAQGVLSTQEAD